MDQIVRMIRGVPGFTPNLNDREFLAEQRNHRIPGENELLLAVSRLPNQEVNQMDLVPCCYRYRQYSSVLEQSNTSAQHMLNLE